MKKENTVLRFLLCAALVFGLFFQGSLKASAIGTVFMVPPIDENYLHDNTLYLSPNYNISAQSWGYGTTADVLNTTGNLGGLLAELHANVTPAGGERILGIYMEGAGLSDSDAAAITGAGWSRVEMYYDTYLVTCLPGGAMYPNIQLVEHEKIGSVLNGAGFVDEFAVLEVTGINSSWAWLIKYDPALSFLRGTSVHIYKYQPDIAVFLEIDEVYFDSYGSNFLEWFDPQLVDPDVNGLYVAVGQALPEDVVCTPDEATELRENPPLITNAEGNVQWKMAPGVVPENFTAEAVMIAESETEVGVEFAYSGALPEGTEVTLQIPQETVSYTEGMELYLYYCNPETQMREFVSSGTYAGQQVTFSIYHCSDYVITSVDHGETYMPEPEQEETKETEAPTEPAETTQETLIEPETTQVTEAVKPAEPEDETGSGWGIIAVAGAVVAAAMVIVAAGRKKKN